MAYIICILYTIYSYKKNYKIYIFYNINIAYIFVTYYISDHSSILLKHDNSA